MHAPKISRRSAVPPFMAMDVMAAAAAREAAGHRIVHMEVGQPGAPAPGPVIEAARAALAKGRIGYTEALGIDPLRRRIARHYGEAYGIDIAADRVVVTTGSSGGFNLAFLAAFDAGDRVALPSPGYPAYRNILTALGLEVVEIATGPETRYALEAETVARIHAERPLAGVLVASPGNPSGTVMPREAMERLAATCRELGIWLISDEIYHRLTYGAPAATALAFSEEAIIVNSFSKYYCMTGWRVGWMIVPERLVRPVERLAQNLYISAPELSQRAAVAAFEATAELEIVKAGYAESRSLLLDVLPGLGFDDIAPADGAFYIYAGVRKLANDSAEFCRRMLEEAGVAITPGADFDRERGHGFVRISFAGAREDICEAIDRLRAWLG